jgi:hypothetical protein
VNMSFLVEVNTKYRTNLNELCMKNTTPHVGTLGQNFSSQVKSKTYLKHYFDRGRTRLQGLFFCIAVD